MFTSGGHGGSSGGHRSTSVQVDVGLGLGGILGGGQGSGHIVAPAAHGAQKGSVTGHPGKCFI